MSGSMKNKIGSQDWFYHAPSKIKNDSIEVVPSLSQIPGLSECEYINEISDTPTRKWIRDTDSDYVKLAKTGGRKDILRYRDQKRPQSPVPYPRVEWYDDDNANNYITDDTDKLLFAAPEWYGHEEHVNNDKGSYSGGTRRPFLGFDAETAWNRNDSSNNKKGKNRKGRSAPERKEDFKLPPIVHKKSLEDGDMVGLLSFKYQSDFIDEVNEKNLSKRKEFLEERRAAKDKYRQENELFQMKKKQSTKVESQKPLFKLSRFENVSSRTVSYR